MLKTLLQVVVLLVPWVVNWPASQLNLGRAVRSQSAISDSSTWNVEPSDIFLLNTGEAWAIAVSGLFSKRALKKLDAHHVVYESTNARPGQSDL